jgi:hypothetical protein
MKRVSVSEIHVRNGIVRSMTRHVHARTDIDGIGARRERSPGIRPCRPHPRASIFSKRA